MGRRQTPIARWSIHATGLAGSSRAPTSRISLSSRLMTIPFCIRRRGSRAPFLLRGVSPRGRRAAEQRGRYVEAERLGGLEIDRQLEIGRCLHGKIGRPCALENPIDILGRAGKCFPQVDAIGYQTALSRHESKWIHRGHAVPVLVSLFLM